MQDDIAMCTNKPYGRDQTDKKEIKVPFGEYMYIVSGGQSDRLTAACCVCFKRGQSPTLKADLGSCNQGTPFITGSHIYQMCHLGLPINVHYITCNNIFCILCISMKFKSRFMTFPHFDMRHSSGQFKLRNYYLPLVSHV